LETILPLPGRGGQEKTGWNASAESFRPHEGRIGGSHGIRISLEDKTGLRREDDTQIGWFDEVGDRLGDPGCREAAERPVPGYVAEEFRGYLECGILCFGFARARCTGCGQGFVVAFSCKARGVCPSCNGRHMAQTAAHLADHVIPPVLIRQWGISVPKRRRSRERLRGMLAARPAAVSALTKISIAEIERLPCSVAGVTRNANAPTAAHPRLGGVSFLRHDGRIVGRDLGRACITCPVDYDPGKWASRPSADADAG